MRMSSINPFSGYVAQGSQVERSQAADKTREVRRTQALSNDVARRDDEMEHQVESADAIVSTNGDEQPQQEQQQRKGGQKPEGDEGEDEAGPRLDVTGGGRGPWEKIHGVLYFFNLRCYPRVKG